MLTRNLLGGVANRICTDPVTLIYVKETDNGDGDGDGSAPTVDVPVASLASVTALQPKDIQRLQFAGQEIKDGVTIVLPFGTERPDRITHSTGNYRIVAYASEHGATVCTCDRITVGAAQ